MSPERKQVLLRIDPAVHDALARWANDEFDRPGRTLRPKRPTPESSLQRPLNRRRDGDAIVGGTGRDVPGFRRTLESGAARDLRQPDFVTPGQRSRT
jgi:hypothetical protein